jgi:hypothetical protein
LRSSKLATVDTGLRYERWFNGSSKGIVELTIDPPARARVLGVPASLKKLRISVTDPEALINALTNP